MAKKSTSDVKSQSTERGISSAVSRALTASLGPVMDRFADAADKLSEAAKKSEKATKNNNNDSKPSKPQTANQKKAAKGKEELNDIFGSKNIKAWQKILGKEGSDSFVKAFSGIKDKKGPAGDVLKQGMSMAGNMGKWSGTLAKGIGGLTKFGGQVVAAYQALDALADTVEMVRGAMLDFYTSVSMVFDKRDGTLDSDMGKRDRQVYLETKEGRQKKADYNFMQPLLQRQAMQRDMFELQKQSETDLLTYSHSLVIDEYNFRKDKEADWMTFSQQQRIQSFEAESQRTKTLFTLNMGYMRSAIGISERALIAIGSSTEAVMEAVKNVGVGLGDSLRNQVKMATSAAGLGAMFGATADDVLKLSKTFRLMDKSTAKQALNMTAGLKSYAKLNGMSPGQLYKEMADSQEEIFKYTNYTGREYAKQIVQLKSMNTSMSSMMKASDAMVLNYKDSIQAEMSLGAMLGQNVDLSETRALLMSGKTSEAASSMRSALSGLDIGAMNPFAKQQLSQATGLGIEELMNMMSGKETKSKGQLEAENAAKTGAAIANGALRQDISNEATKLAMEQDFRAKMLKFEQEKRIDMLAIEQLQRLDGIALEAKWRIKTAKLETDTDIDKAVMQLRSNAAASNMANLFGNFTGELKNMLPAKANAQQISDATKLYGQSQEQLADMIGKGLISGSNMKILDYREAAAKSAAKGQQLDAGKFFDVGKIADTKYADLQKQEAELVKQLKYANLKEDEGIGSWDERNIPGWRSIDWGGTSYVDKENKRIANQNRISETQDALSAVRAQMQTAGGTSAKYSTKPMPVFDPTKKPIVIKPGPEMSAQQQAAQKEQQAVWANLQTSLNAGKDIDKVNKENIAHGNRIQQEQIAQQATTNVLLQALVDSSAKPINLDGVKLNNTLLNRNRAAYGIVK